MAEKNKQPVSESEKGRSNKLKAQQDAPDFDSNIEEMSEMLEAMSEVSSTALNGDEVGDPDIGVLAQQEEENLEEEALNLESPHIVAELSEDPVPSRWGSFPCSSSWEPSSAARASRRSCTGRRTTGWGA